MRLLRTLALGLSGFVILTTLVPNGAKANVMGLPASKPETWSPLSTSSDSPTNTTNIYLPCVEKNHCQGAGPSPFGIQIAGLSDFTAPAGLSKASVDQLRAQQYAELNAVFPTLVEALRDSGAGWARVYVDWSMIQPNSPTEFDWTTYDSWMSQVASAGVQMIATISNPPAWAIITTNPTNPCSNRISLVQDFYNFLSTIINRYKITPYGIHTWEVLNEPDAIDGVRCTTGASNYGQHGAEYAALLEGAITVIKTADPSAKVIMGGIADDSFYLPYNDTTYYDGSTKGKFNRYFTDDMITAGAANSFDAVNFHYFHDFSDEWERWTTGNLPTCGNYTIRDPNQPTYPVTGLDIIAKGSFFLNRLRTCYNVNKPLWITEVGRHGINPNTVVNGINVLSTRPDDTLDNQARYVLMVNTRGLSLGAENITWYALKIVPSITTYDYQGLLYDSRDPSLDNQPKPAFYAFKTLTHELAGFQFSSTLAAPPDVEAYAFMNPCQVTKIVAWYNQTTGSVPFVISAKSVNLVYRPYDDGTDHLQTITDGGPGDLDHLVNGSITISLDLEPIIIQPNT